MICFGIFISLKLPELNGMFVQMIFLVRERDDLFL